jgi:hypothetical protein
MTPTAFYLDIKHLHDPKTIPWDEMREAFHQDARLNSITPQLIAPIYLACNTTIKRQIFSDVEIHSVLAFKGLLHDGTLSVRMGDFSKKVRNLQHQEDWTPNTKKRTLLPQGTFGQLFRYLSKRRGHVLSVNFGSIGRLEVFTSDGTFARHSLPAWKELQQQAQTGTGYFLFAAYRPPLEDFHPYWKIHKNGTLTPKFLLGSS